MVAVNYYLSPIYSQSEKEKNLKKYLSHVVAEPLIPTGVVEDKDLLSKVEGLLFKYTSTPGVVAERAYMANSSDQKRMSDEARHKFGKFN